MRTPIDPWLLWSRASCVGLIAFGLGTVGHVTADGLLPGLLPLAILLGLSVLLAAPLLARPASAPRLIALLVGGQTLIHLVLTVAAGHRGDPAGPSGAAAAVTVSGPRELPVVDGRRVGSLQDVYDGMSATSGHLAPSLPIGQLTAELSAHAPMMAVHLAAAVGVGAWLARGERCLWTLIALAGRRILTAAWAVRPLVVLPSARLLAAADDTHRALRSRWVAGPATRRGPPLPAA